MPSEKKFRDGGIGPWERTMSMLTSYIISFLIIMKNNTVKDNNILIENKINAKKKGRIF